MDALTLGPWIQVRAKKGYKKTFCPSADEVLVGFLYIQKPRLLENAKCKAYGKSRTPKC